MGHETWVLVSDACRARLFIEQGRHGLVELEGFACPASREHIKDRVTDRAGLKPAGAHGVRVGASQEVNPKEAEAKAFARHLADYLYKKLNMQAYRELVLAAPPHFLGLLRAALNDSVSQRVVASFDRDYTTLDPAELMDRLYAKIR